jgi:hypothetical protein
LRQAKIWLALMSCWRAMQDTEAPGFRFSITISRLNDAEWCR